MRHQWPIIRTTSAALASISLAAALHWDSLSATALTTTAAAWILAGALYTQLFEYWCHRVPMHRRVRFLEGIRWNHLQHHRIFHGANFQTRDPGQLEHIAGRYWVFPVLFLIHYALLATWMPVKALIPFLLGCVLHYVAFEISHWLSHIEDNAVDRMLARVPVIGDLRGYQIEHHRRHHQRPTLAFNFNPPYLGDRIFGHMPNRAENDVVVPAPPPALLPPVVSVARASISATARWSRPLLRYGSAVAVGAAIVGAVILARGVWTHGRRSMASSQA